MLIQLLYFSAFFAISYVNGENRIAVAHLVSGTVTGTVSFAETTNGLRVTGSITGLPAGSYGFHVHELGDTTTCDTSGGHFNPNDNTHGGRDHEERHVGDLGNVVFVGEDNAVATFNYVDSVIALRGRHNIVGRTLVLHGQEDDLGLGENEGSLTTGNAGPRVACGVIGIRFPPGAWDSGAASLTPSILLLLVGTAYFFHRL